MPPVETRSEYSLDRAEAARYLGVSTRTLDRYVRSGKVSSKKIGYHVMLSQKDVDILKRELGERVDDISVVVEEDVVEEKIQRKIPVPRHEEGIVSGQDLENEIYRVLFERTQQSLEKKQKEMEMLNFRLGQMEIELKNRVPLLEYQGNVEQLEKQKIDLEKALDQSEVANTQFKRDLVVQKLLKTVYLGLFLTAVVALLLTFAIR